MAYAKTTTNTNRPTVSSKIDEMFNNILGPTDKDVDVESCEKLLNARVALLINEPFFGNLATRLILKNADTWCRTAATDGRNFYYNSRFISMLEPKEIEFLFGHEVLHCVYDHMGRRGDRDHRLFNIANDYCVNNDLVKHKIGKLITTIDVLYDPKYDEWSSEAVYDDLYKKADKININELLRKMLDEHLDEKNHPEPLSKEERDEIRDEMIAAVLGAIGSAGSNVPMGVKRMIKDLTEPKLDWREMLRSQLESTIKTDFNWSRQSRKGWHTDAIMPGMDYSTAIDIAIGIDASGSISSKMLNDFTSEVQGIMNSFTSYRIHMFTFDTAVYGVKEYNSDNLDSICDYEVSGGGGTSFECIFSHLRDTDLDVKRLIVFTDGLPYGSWGDENLCDTLWIIHGSDSIVAPFGTTTYYEAD